MGVLFCGITGFCLALIIHFVIWRISPPKSNHAVVLSGIFLGILAMSLFIFKSASGAVTLPRNFFEYLDYSIFYCALSLAYLVSYPAVEADSPSLAVMLRILKAAPGGLDKNELDKAMTDEVLIIPRIKDLTDDKLICTDRGRYSLTSKGVFFVNIFIAFRNLLKLPKGG